MNVENIRKVIEVIQNEDNFFNMMNYIVNESLQELCEKSNISVPGCGTPACIAGWAAHLARAEGVAKHRHEEDIAYDYLSIEDYNLFFAEDKNGFVSPENWFIITRQEAIETLEKLIKTGEIDWSHAKNYELWED